MKYLRYYFFIHLHSVHAQSCLIPSHPMDCSLPGSSVHGIFQARILVWGLIVTFDSKESKNEEVVF